MNVSLVNMKWIRNALLIVIATLGWLAAAAEVPRPTVPSRPAADYPAPPETSPSEPRFDLDFQGGSPAELVKAIETAAGAPLNVIIPKEYESVSLPKLKLKRVTVPEFFQALTLATEKRVIT